MNQCIKHEINNGGENERHTNYNDKQTVTIRLCL
jgi:hypothetical protein